jgi:hypothetical protein
MNIFILNQIDGIDYFPVPLAYWVALSIAILNAILPMHYINELLYRTVEEEYPSLTVDEAKEKFKWPYVRHF